MRGRKVATGAVRRHLAARLLLAATLLVLAPFAAGAEEGVIERARAASADGRRDEGLALLEAHLTESPRDVDARLVYGLMLSWEGRYEEARAALERVLEQTPGYTDARVALMNVEWWSGRSEHALDLSRQILAEHANHPQARYVEERIGAADRPWTLTSTYSLDWFDDDRDPWHETSVAIGRQTPWGSVTARGRHAERFGLSDQQIELEAYPRFRPGTYAYVGVGFATQENLYPTYRVGFDLYQSLPWSLEASLGYRRLGFSSATDIVVGSLSKYWGNWMFTGRVYHVPAAGDLDSTSYHGSVRRYFGEAGTSFVGLRYAHGLGREELRDRSDLVNIDSDSLSAQIDVEFWGRFRLAFSSGFSHQERAGREPLWQVSCSTSVGVRF